MLGVLAATDVVTVWMIWVLAGLTGTATALGIPALQSFLYEMVGPDDLANAVGLNSVVINTSRIIGPAVGAVLIASFGVAPCFFFNAASFLAVIAALLLMRDRRAAPGQTGRARARAGARGAQVRVAARRRCACRCVMLAVISTLAYNYSVVLPLLTKSVFGRGGGSYGVLSSAMGVGALAGALLMASQGATLAPPAGRRRLRLRRRHHRAGARPRATSPGSRSWSSSAAPGVLFISTTNALLQLNAADAMRGRVMALWSIVFLGSTPIGGPITGLLVRGLGVRWAIAIGGLAVLATATGALLALRHGRVVEEGSCEAPVCLPDGPAPGDALGEAVEVGSRRRPTVRGRGRLSAAPPPRRSPGAPGRRG